MTIVFYWQNTTVGVLRHATGRFPLCSVLLVLSYFSCINKVIQRILLHLTLKVISKGFGLAVTVCGTKGVFTPLKRRLAPAMGQDAHSNGKIKIELFCLILHRFVVLLSFYYRTI